MGASQSLRQRKQDVGALEADKPSLQLLFSLFAGVGSLLLSVSVSLSPRWYLKETLKGGNKTHEKVPVLAGGHLQQGPTSTNRDKNPRVVSRFTASFHDKGEKEGNPCHQV